jgi:hypothetical protein
MEASAEFNRVAGVTWRKDWSAEANFAGLFMLLLCALFTVREHRNALYISRWRLPKASERHGRNSDGGESDHMGTAILRGSMWQRQIDIDML